MSKEIYCNICLSKGNIAYMKTMDGYFVCPHCKNESWPDREGRFIDRWKRERNREINSNPYVSLSQQPGVEIHGGSDPSGTTPDIGKKKSTQQIYKQLFKET